MTDATYLDARATEEALVGALLLSPDHLDDVAEVLSPGDIRTLSVRHVFEAMLALRASNVAVDLLTLAQQMTQANTFADAGGAAYFAELVGSVPTAMHVLDYARMVKQFARRRGLLQAASEIARLAGAAESDDVIEDARAIIERHAIEVIDNYAPLSASELAVIEVPDEPYMLRPFIIRGGLNLIAGDIGAGKTWALQDLALGVATASRAWGVQPTLQGGVLLLSADQSRDDDHRRLLDLCAGRGIKPPVNLWFDHDTWNFTKRESFGRLRRFIQVRGIVLLGIDAAVRYFSGDSNDAGDVSMLMRELRALANATGVTIVLLHHLSKPNQMIRPRLADRVRGSGDWLAAVDSGLVIVTEGADDNKVRHLVQVKNRAGPEAASSTFEIELLELGGLVLTFGAGDGAATASSLADIAADALLRTLRETPGKTFIRADLVASLTAQGVKVSSRTLDGAFRQLASLTSVRVTKNPGRPSTYVSS